MKFISGDVRRFRIMLVFLYIVVISLALTMVALFFYLIFDRYMEEGIEEEDFEYYKYREYNPLGNESSTGIVSIPEHIQPHEYLTFSYEDYQNVVLVSNFNDDEYRCTGSCFCGDSDNTRRSSVSILRRGVVFFMTAVSSVYAFQKAKDHFQDECVAMYMNECPSEVRSTVDGCENVRRKRKTKSPYLCQGDCIPNKELTEDHLAVIKRRNINVEEECSLITSFGEVSTFSLDEAKVEFIKKTLTSSCVRISALGGRPTNICVAGNVDNNPSVKCVVDDDDFQGW